ncbi:hypothetical protein [Roseicyclus persicicus]|uniref:Uncharacterized protein n=1 Tax=Roseicyclus persicicus TaxID=2650661 RepID=A0A7X6GYW1_9RHOB|nr:hypothetical protein [Roseibacterium persicicum]NKX44927.1 hypothetical protein [Roseibacterium persicicum]
MRAATACLLALTATAAAQTPPTLEALRAIEAPDPVLSYRVGDSEVALLPWDVAAVELSESGGITDIFLRLAPGAAAALAARVAAAPGVPVAVTVCGAEMEDAILPDRAEAGTLYLANTTWPRGEAVRALWQGRARCDTVQAEVFTHAN